MDALDVSAAVRLRAALAAGIVIAMAACTTASAPPLLAAADPAAACAALAAPIAPASIGLPSGGATIDSAQYFGASAELATNPLPFVPPPPEAVIAPAMPPHCRVVGRIASLDPAAPPIRFQVNLPDAWSGRYLQLGGGGFNG
ncbi:MAG TPA: tannase/feruloyl esterase family alpha/beta hydrolase, partial [Caldimonas sp.]